MFLDFYSWTVYLNYLLNFVQLKEKESSRVKLNLIIHEGLETLIT